MPVFAIPVNEVPSKNTRLPVGNDVAFVPPSAIAMACVRSVTLPPRRFATRFAVTNVGCAMLMVLKSCMKCSS